MVLEEIIQNLHSIKDDKFFDTPNTSVLDKWHKLQPFTIKEGLIKTYPSTAVAHTIAQLFELNIDNWDYGKNGKIWVKKERSSEEERIYVELKSGSEGFSEGVTNYMLKYGWFFAEQEYVLNGIRLIFEKKFGDRYSASDILKRVGDKFLYHITSSKIAEKIKKEGFVPKTHTDDYLKGSVFKDSDDIKNRVYFFIEKPDESMVRTWGSVAVSRTGGEPVLITVNPEFISKDVSFFVDPRWARAVFTYEPISPFAIYSIDEFEI